jgi:uncharacterized protein (TIGR02466 family)
MIIENLFPQFIAHENLNLDISKLEKYCIDKYNTDKDSRIISNVGGWQSLDYGANKETNETIQPLIHLLNEKASEVAHKIGLNSNLTVTGFWININPTGTLNKEHVHTGSIFSAVLYIKADLNCGNLVLKNPNYIVQNSYLHYWHLLNQENSSIFTLPTLSVTPKENLLLIFPSWIEHSVGMNLSQYDRISIAFNFGISK